DAVGNLGLQQKHDARRERGREGFVDQGRGDGVGDVADDLEGSREPGAGSSWLRRVDEIVPVEAECVSIDDFQLLPALRSLLPERRCQPAILLYGNHQPHARRQDGRQAPLPGSDLYHDVVGRGLERVDDALQDVVVGEEVLAEPLVPDHTLRMTTVRSSAGGAPPVKPARSACTDSRISWAGRSFSRVTWPSTRSSPKRSPRPPSASVTP